METVQNDMWSLSPASACGSGTVYWPDHAINSSLFFQHPLPHQQAPSLAGQHEDTSFIFPPSESTLDSIHSFSSSSDSLSPDYFSTFTSDSSGIYSSTPSSARPKAAKSGKVKGQGKKGQQRNAANQRERRRMKTINDAFDGLRSRIPDAKDDQKMSKVDTLRLAIRYINQLSAVLRSVGDEDGETGQELTAAQSKQPPKPEKVLIRYHNAENSSPDVDLASLDHPLYGHSLSWCHSPDGVHIAENRLSAKVWTPHRPTTDDLAQLNMS